MRLHGRINDVADNFFYRLGYWVATHTKRTLFISLALVIACCSGFTNFRIEADGERGNVLDNKDVLTHYFRAVGSAPIIILHR